MELSSSYCVVFMPANLFFISCGLSRGMLTAIAFYLFRVSNQLLKVSFLRFPFLLQHTNYDHSLAWDSSNMYIVTTCAHTNCYLITAWNSRCSLSPQCDKKPQVKYLWLTRDRTHDAESFRPSFFPSIYLNGSALWVQFPVGPDIYFVVLYHAVARDNMYYLLLPWHYLGLKSCW